MSPITLVMALPLGVAFGIFIAANLLIPAWWFIKDRRRYRARLSESSHVWKL